MKGELQGGHTEGTNTNEEVKGVAGVGDDEGSGGAVVGDREAEELRGNAMGWALAW
jgi:hypothetical protein